MSEPNKEIVSLIKAAPQDIKEKIEIVLFYMFYNRQTMIKSSHNKDPLIMDEYSKSLDSLKEKLNQYLKTAKPYIADSSWDKIQYEVKRFLEEDLMEPGMVPTNLPQDVHKALSDGEITALLVNADDLVFKAKKNGVEFKTTDVQKILDTLLCAIPGMTEPPPLPDTKIGKAREEVSDAFWKAVFSSTLATQETIQYIIART